MVKNIYYFQSVILSVLIIHFRVLGVLFEDPNSMIEQGGKTRRRKTGAAHRNPFDIIQYGHTIPIDPRDRASDPHMHVDPIGIFNAPLLDQSDPKNVNSGFNNTHSGFTNKEDTNDMRREKKFSTPDASHAVLDSRRSGSGSVGQRRRILKDISKSRRSNSTQDHRMDTYFEHTRISKSQTHSHKDGSFEGLMQNGLYHKSAGSSSGTLDERLRTISQNSNEVFFINDQRPSSTMSHRRIIRKSGKCETKFDLLKKL